MANTSPYKRIGVIGAMQVEIDLLIQTMKRQGAVSMSTIAGQRLLRGKPQRNSRCRGPMRLLAW